MVRQSQRPRSRQMPHTGVILRTLLLGIALLPAARSAAQPTLPPPSPAVPSAPTLPPPAVQPAPVDPHALTAPAVDPHALDIPLEAGPEKHDHIWTLLPPTLLWEPPLANPLQPRFFVKNTTFQAWYSTGTLDTAIGATVPWFRRSPDGCPEEGIQVDFFAVAFPRFQNKTFLVATDYRFGMPITFRYGAWEGKFGFEHTSTHLGDDFMRVSGRTKDPHVRDEIVAGLAYRWWKQFRIYGIIGVAAGMTHPFREYKERDRYNVGLEWSMQRPTGWCGQPFAAVDLETRHDQDFEPNLTVQTGWQWIGDDGHRSLRLALEYYTGRSPFGQFFMDREQWLGAGLWYDF